MPWPASRPTPCTSVMLISMATSFWRSASPNSRACLISFCRSAPALANATASALLDCADSRKDAKSLPGNG
ncbi:hypothetical protein D3C85_1321350 [compost metagenome]